MTSDETAASATSFAGNWDYLSCARPNSVTSTPRDLTAEPSSPAAESVSIPQSGTGQEPSRVLVVEPHPTLRTVLVQRLRHDGHLTAAVSRASEALEVCQEQSPDLSLIHISEPTRP